MPIQPTSSRSAVRHPTPIAWRIWRQLCADHPLPAAFLDLDAFEANIDATVEAIASTHVTLRVASKSVRHPDLLRRILARGGDRLQGLMTWSADEAACLVGQGFDDLLMGYPVSRLAEARTLAGLAASGVTIRAMIDAPDHVELLEAAAAACGATLEVCIDVDASLRVLGGRLHLGVRRSPVRSTRDAVELARLVRRAGHLRLVGLMAYEAQVAGMREHNANSRHLDPIRRLIRSRSIPHAASRRQEVVDALRAEGFALSLVNGGGTGSLRTTSAEAVVTEVTAGSAFTCPHLFDDVGRLALQPALFFVLPVCRRSDPDFITCAGGGYIASGATDPDKAPRVHLPHGLRPLGVEGWGEVQTPLLRDVSAPELRLGDPVVCRHAKAGELAERFDRYTYVRGDQIVGSQPTWRGLGHTFY